MSVQARNDTNTTSDREALQLEASEIIKEVDRIANSTEFNTKKLLNQPTSSPTAREAVLDNLKRGWLSASEALISNALGIGRAGMDLTITLRDTIDGAGNMAAQVRYSYPSGVPGTVSTLELQIDMADFTPTSWPDGNKSFISQDRIIAHKMVHAAMATNVNIGTGMQTWFMEGMVEVVHGADERLVYCNYYVNI